jgi:hypothetical protein
MSKSWWTGLHLADLYQRRMILNRPTSWRDIILPAGTIITLGYTQTRWSDLRFTADPCPHCGAQLRAMIPREHLDFAPGTCNGIPRIVDNPALEVPNA